MTQLVLVILMIYFESGGGNIFYLWKMKKRSKMVEKTALDQINTIGIVSKWNRIKSKYASRYNKID